MAELRAPGALLLIAAALAVIALRVEDDRFGDNLMGGVALLAVIGLLLAARALLRNRED